jgi:hypothetical protein
MAIQPFDPSLYPALRSGPSGPITATPEASFVIRSSLAELVSLDDADFANGLNAYVVDEGEIYVLDTSNAFTVYSGALVQAKQGLRSCELHALVRHSECGRRKPSFRIHSGPASS